MFLTIFKILFALLNSLEKVSQNDDIWTILKLSTPTLLLQTKYIQTRQILSIFGIYKNFDLYCTRKKASYLVQHNYHRQYAHNKTQTTKVIVLRKINNQKYTFI